MSSPNPNKVARDCLASLEKQLAAITIPADGHLTALNALGILHVPGYDFENLDDETANLSETPPFLFKPMPLSDPQKRNPVDTSMNDKIRGFKDYQARPADWHYDARSCVMRVCGNVEDWATVMWRPNVFKAKSSSLLSISKLHKISRLNPFYLGRSLNGSYSDLKFPFTHSMILESNDFYPHILFSGYQPFDGKNGRILFGELMMLFSAMKNRADQLNVKDDEDAESLFEKEPEELRNYKRRFPEENRFPVLMLSYVGLQHGRLFYACLNGQQLVIRQSKLYSFERQATAPLDFFASFVLSSPLRKVMRHRVKPRGIGATRKLHGMVILIQGNAPKPISDR